MISLSLLLSSNVLQKPDENLNWTDIFLFPKKSSSGLAAVTVKLPFFNLLSLKFAYYILLSASKVVLFFVGNNFLTKYLIKMINWQSMFQTFPNFIIMLH